MPALSELKPGQHARVTAIQGDAFLMQRLAEFGLFEGEMIAFLGKAPLGDPIEIGVGETRLSLRKSEAACIQVVLIEHG
jgi:ferrous iron transport protein A